MAVYMHATHILKCSPGTVKSSVCDASTIAAFEAHWREHADTLIEGRNAIVNCICRQLSGLFDVKLALLLMIVGGVRRQHSENVRLRGEAHMLLIGDAGTGKSILMKFAARMVPRFAPLGCQIGRAHV